MRRVLFAVLAAAPSCAFAQRIVIDVPVAPVGGPALQLAPVVSLSGPTLYAPSLSLPAMATMPSIATMRPAVAAQPAGLAAPRYAADPIPEKPVVTHNAQLQQFEMKIGDEIGLLQYKYMPDGNIVTYHTEIPVAFRGRNLAAALAEASIAFAREKGLYIYPTCHYMQAYLKKHKEHHDIVHPVAKKRYIEADSSTPNS